MSKKPRFECRLNEGTHARLRELAEGTGVSMNQIIEGILVWAADRSNLGMVEQHENGPGYYESIEAPAVWFGSDGFDDEGNPQGDGAVLFVLDFSPGRTVIEGREVDRG